MLTSKNSMILIDHYLCQENPMSKLANRDYRSSNITYTSKCNQAMLIIGFDVRGTALTFTFNFFGKNKEKNMAFFKKTLDNYATKEQHPLLPEVVIKKDELVLTAYNAYIEYNHKDLAKVIFDCFLSF